MKLYYKEAYGNNEVRGFVNAIDRGDFLHVTKKQYDRAESKVMRGTKPQFVTDKYVRIYSEIHNCYLD